MTLPNNEKPHFSVLVGQYKELSHRAKSKIRRSFNTHFGLSDDDSTFSRLIGGTLRLCADEYDFLLPLITHQYQFLLHHEKQSND